MAEAQDKETVFAETKNILKCLFESFEICIQDMQEGQSQEGSDAILPIEKRVENVNKRKQCFNTQFARYIHELS